MAAETLVIKKYGNRRLYDTEASCYITLDDLAKCIKSGRDVRVVDAKTRADLTKSVLLQIISEQEKEKDLLPLSFLRRTIQLRDTPLSESFQYYLSVSLETFLNAQQEFEKRYRSLAGSLLNPILWMMPQVSQIMAMGKQALPIPYPPMAKDNPEARQEPPLECQPHPSTPFNKTDQSDQETQEQIKELKAQVAQISKLLAKLDT